MSDQPMLAVIDYGMGNRRSVQKALERVGAVAVITSDADLIRGADGLVIPGVGAFPRAMAHLRALDLIELIRERATEQIPLLGICLGMQLLFERSVELEPTEGIGLIPGEVGWLQTGGLRVPHIGWSEVSFVRDSPLTDGLPAAGCPFYHVHSLAVTPRDEADVIGTAEYGAPFVTFVQHGPIAGVQFHPEKSSADGLRLLENFVRACGVASGRSPRGAAARA
ncbi:MAG TPA: imidazole glycerol phosphate synthase subunit HisH [Solirubrobacteraceae bacterium]|jgi:glutamine amidotransferase